MSKILIIEDDPILSESLADFLKEEGMEVVIANNGKQGVELAINELPDLILCDIFMPKLNGYETFERLKNDINTSLIPFIFLTAKAEREDILYGMTLGADDYITKPVDFDQLMERITKRMKKNQESVRRSEIKYHAIFEKAHDAILLIRLTDLSIIDLNLAACNILGQTREDIIKSSGRRFLKGFDLKEEVDDKDTKRYGLQAFDNIERVWETKDKKKIQVLVSGKMVNLFSENYLFMVAQDITERKKYEDQLILAKEKAEESDRLKTSILSNISHELRTPLNGILGFSELLMDDLRDSEYFPMVDNIYVSGKRLMTTLNSIITLSQLQAGKVTMISKPVKITPVIESVCKLYEEAIREKNISLKKVLHEEIIIYSDIQLFKQVIKEILDNAVKFTTQGEITIRTNTVKADGVQWQTVEVKDTGVGIEKEHSDMIFNEFRQASEGYARKFQGSGLGLTISKRICEMMKGKITLESTPGKGSSFTIWLPAPITEKEVPTKSAEGKPGLKSTPPVKEREVPLVLLVEDNMINKNLIELFLKPTFRMDYAKEGTTAVKMATDTRYDAVLMDINLGTGMDGIEATKKIKSLPGYEKIPIIAVTGYTMIGDREKLIAEGCTHYIAKPFEKSAFLAVVNDAIFGSD
jgi:PAS domain S-box-containing protein